MKTKKEEWPMRFKDPKLIALIQEHMPGFIFEKNLSNQDMQSIMRIVHKKATEAEERKRTQSRLDLINKKGIAPGTKIVDSYVKDKKYTVVSITELGYIMIQEKKGAFSPERVERT
jgi:hypothetical protein